MTWRWMNAFQRQLRRWIIHFCTYWYDACHEGYWGGTVRVSSWLCLLYLIEFSLSFRYVPPTTIHCLMIIYPALGLITTNFLVMISHTWPINSNSNMTQNMLSLPVLKPVILLGLVFWGSYCDGNPELHHYKNSCLCMCRWVFATVTALFTLLT